MSTGINAAWPRVAVVGCGYWGKNLVRNFAELGVLAALVDHTQARAADLAAVHGGTPATFESVLADTAIGAVAFATPGPSHFEMATAALNAGKHVYVEKPLTMSVTEAEALVARARHLGRNLMVGHILRHHAAFVTVLQRVRDGEIGPVRHVISTRWNLGKILPDEDVLWSLAPHDLSMVGALLGYEPEIVTCQGDAFLRAGVADVATARLTWPGRASAEIRLNWMAPFKEHRLIVWGERGCIIFDDTKAWEEKVSIRRMGLDWSNPDVIPPPGTTESVPLPPAEPLKAECRDFLDSITSGRAPVTDGAEGLAVVRMLDRAARSMAQGGRAC